MSEENVERVREADRLFREGDPTWTDGLADDIEWDISAHPLPDVPNRGSGKDRLLTEVFAAYLEGWLDYRNELAEVVDAGDDVVVVMHETARMRGSDTALDRDLVHVWTFRDALVVLYRVFPDRGQALDAVGLEE
jgi:ketosteroid isomerase-like protein